VTGFDSSAGMLELARRRLGDDADLRVADLGHPLPFPDGAFDDVIASLVLHYLEDWTAPLAGTVGFSGASAFAPGFSGITDGQQK
jgi:ubiquinone/menaquinone biosynthesis C-methylase UbiE